jgi:hypothetical protein
LEARHRELKSPETIPEMVNAIRVRYDLLHEEEATAGLAAAAHLPSPVLI